MSPFPVQTGSFPADVSRPAEVLDPRRLAALEAYEILDTPPEPEFDDIVHVATKICNTPVALVSLVDIHRQWFKARVGFAVCETTIDQSVCAYALQEEALLVIPDLMLDPRTKHNGLVTGEPFIRFYAGVVLKTPEGAALGTLCVIDNQPRPQGLTADQTEALLALGRQTMVVMGMRRAVMERAEALLQERYARRLSVERAQIIDADRQRMRLEEARIRLAQEAGGIGTFDIDVASDRCFASASFWRIFGLPVEPSYPMSRLQELIFDDDRAIASTFSSRQHGTAPREVEYRIRRAHDDAIRWIGRRNEFQIDENGVVQRMFGVVQDVTERKLVEARRTALLDLGDDLRDVTSVREVETMTARMLGETLSVQRAGFCTIDTRGQALTVDEDFTGADVTSIAGRYRLEVVKQTIARLEQGAPIVVSNIPAAAWMSNDAVWFDRIGTKAKITVPLMEHGRLIGLVFAHSVTPRTWSPGEEDFVQAVADRSYAVIAKLRAEEQQRLLNMELSHRLKNTLAMVQAIATQTLRHVTEKDAVRAFEDRIIALSRAHDVLLQQNWSAARIETVIESVVSLHGRSEKFDISGPDLTLGPKATLSISLLIHELATNAVKYGALSRDAGRVALEWHVDLDEREPHLVMTWREYGGPPASAPTRRGFGTRLISMGIAGTAKARLNYGVDGLDAEFRAPLSVVEES